MPRTFPTTGDGLQDIEEDSGISPSDSQSRESSTTLNSKSDDANPKNTRATNVKPNDASDSSRPQNASASGSQPGKPSNEARAKNASASDSQPNSTSDDTTSNTVSAEEHRISQGTFDKLTSATAKLLDAQKGLEEPCESCAESRRALSSSNQELRDRVADLEAQLASQKSEADLLAKQVRIVEGIIEGKGQDSPCWYRDSIRHNGDPYERPEYLFHVRMGDERILVYDIEAPARYIEQKQDLPYDRDSLFRELTDVEFLQAFRSLRIAGENKDVRTDRRCTFYVQVWDSTSSRERYKRVHNHVVQAVFNTFEDPTDPIWPH